MIAYVLKSSLDANIRVYEAQQPRRRGYLRRICTLYEDRSTGRVHIEGHPRLGSFPSLADALEAYQEYVSAGDNADTTASGS